MKYLQSSYKGHHEEIILNPFGDLHKDSKHYKEDILLRQLERIDKNRENNRILLMGDLMETALKDSVGAGVYEQEETAHQQIYRVKNLFWDFRELIDIIVPGNHEERVYQRTGIDITELLADKLEISDRYARFQGVVKYNWNNRAYNVAVWHGSGGGRGSALNKLMKQRETVLADVYLMGHTHGLESKKTRLYIPDTRNNRMATITQVFVVTGSALDYDGSYAEQYGLPPTELGFPKIILGGKTIQKKGKFSRLKEIKVEI